MRVLITGAAGQLGTDLVPAFYGHEVIATTRAQLDVADRDSTLAAITSTEPEIVVHTAAWTAVDACEADRERAMRVNALGTRHVGDAARRIGAHVCYISTDYVFDGTATEPYDEWAQPNPQSVYGASKYAGERELADGATVVRLSWVVGPHGKNFVKTILRLAAEPGRDELRVVRDQRGCPTFTTDVAPVIRRLAIGRHPGVYHVTNQGDTTWFDLAEATLGAAGIHASRTRVVPITTEEYGAPAPRPRNSVLDNAAIRALGFDPLPPWQESLERTVKELTN